MSELLRRGRLASINKNVTKFTSSIRIDNEILMPTIKINQAHVIMMIEQKIVNPDDGAFLLKALEYIKRKKMGTTFEDVHMYIEEEVIRLVGPNIGGNLHIAKSRNDQISTAIRIKLRERLILLIDLLIRIQKSIIELAENNFEKLFPGYTHLQPAQPVIFSHYLISYIDAFYRDIQRFQDSYPRVNLCPMGACALATTSFNINRKRISNLMGFNDLLENSIDAVGSRDFLLEIMAFLAILATNISRIAEDLIVWSSLNFSLIELPDDFAFTSSVMPQKKNPDVLEVIRARMSSIFGNFLSCVAIVKAIPSGYSMDFQELTPILWLSMDTIDESINILSKLFPKLKVNEGILNDQKYDFITSTELANILTRKYNVPFRMAHRIVGSLCRYLIEKRLTVSNITPELLEKIAKESTGLNLKATKEDIESSLDLKKFVESHFIIGGPSSKEVKRMMENRRQKILSSKNWLTETKSKLSEADKKLECEIKINLK